MCGCEAVRFALIMTASFVLLTGGMWAFIFAAMFYAAVTIERAAARWLRRITRKEY